MIISTCPIGGLSGEFFHVKYCKKLLYVLETRSFNEDYSVCLIPRSHSSRLQRIHSRPYYDYNSWTSHHSWEDDHLHSSTHILHVDIPSLHASWVAWSQGYSLSGCHVPCQVKILWSRLESWIATHEQETRNGGRMRLWQYSRNWKIWMGPEIAQVRIVAKRVDWIGRKRSVSPSLDAFLGRGISTLPGFLVFFLYVAIFITTKSNLITRWPGLSKG